MRERPPPRGSSPEPAEPDAHDHDDARSDASSTGLPPPLISAEDYDAFVCFACVSKIDTLRRYAGTKGAIIVARDDANDTWRRLEGNSPSEPDGHHDDSLVDIDDARPVSIAKRPRSSSPGEEREAKRPRTTTSSPCLAPPVNTISEVIYTNLAPDLKVSRSSLGAGDVFLTEGWRQRWCRCSHVSLHAMPWNAILFSFPYSVCHHWKPIHTYLKKNTLMNHRRIPTLV